ncbi:MAG: glycosyltransferase family 4 protein [Alphaproteobacteria bacterium]|nr:glycosyltransferase family 4 protein [Alphaproteobacteria bacterium]
MVTLKILYDVEGWAYYNNAVALQKYAPPDFEVSLAAYLHDSDLKEALGDAPPDILVLCRFQSIRKVRDELQRLNWPTKLVSIWNNGWPERSNILADVLDKSDLVVFANYATWNNAGRPAHGVMIPIGVDLDIFNVRKPIAERQPKVLWCGSELMRELKGYDEYAVPLATRLERQGICTNFRLVDSFSDRNLAPEEMADWYNTGTVFVCTSRTEGTPNVALEAAASGCALVSTRVGNMTELIRNGENGMLVDREIVTIHDAVEKAILRHTQLATAMQTTIANWSWEKRSKQFYKVVRPLARSVDRTAPIKIAEGKPDLSDEVTVFVLTVGAPSYESCLSFLRRQDCRFRLEIIDHVAPISAANQRMHDRCKTPYFVQVDEDMLLYPHAVRTLHRTIKSQPPNIALYCAYLHDVHLGRPVQGVKIHRHDIVRNYPFRNVAGCDVEQNRRLRADGYNYAVQALGSGRDPFTNTLGLHGVAWTDETIYLRYFILESRRRHESGFGVWQSELFTELGAKFRQDPSRQNFLALMGALIGWMEPEYSNPFEKDFHKYGDTPGLQAVLRMLDELEATPGRSDTDDGLGDIDPSLSSKLAE